MPYSIRLIATLLVLSLLTACAQPGRNYPAENPYDPLEKTNRGIHAFNVSLDKNFVRPVARGYRNVMPDDIETMITRFAENAAIPSYVLNNALRGDMYAAGLDVGRFVVNSTIGLAGFFDPASEFNMAPASDTDFGEVLYVWGFGEGAYLEVPALGPSTVRDATGMVVGYITNPLNLVIPSPESYIVTGASVGSVLSARGRYEGTIDSVLHESADSYAQARLLYLQNRHFELEGQTNSFDDPYGESSEAASVTNVSSNYEDPYDG